MKAITLEPAFLDSGDVTERKLSGNNFSTISGQRLRGRKVRHDYRNWVVKLF
jgi:hypothetical protein